MRCQHCHGDVSNIEGRRRRVEELVATHEATCPGLYRGTKNRKPTTNESENQPS